VATIKRYTLDHNTDVPIKILGISCHYKMYRLAWILNRNLNFHLRQLNDDYFPFPLFQYYERLDRITYSLIQNKTQNDIFISEQMSIDYFLAISSENKLNIDSITKKLHELSSIIAVFSFEIEEIPSIKDSLLYFVE